MATLDHKNIRSAYARFWTERGHREVPAIPLIPKEDPTTLFTGSGMQQLVPYLLGEIHPLGTRLFNVQRCIRTQDIEEVGDNRHDSFFEMMGNWSLGDYFKIDQLTWFFTFLVDVLGIDPSKLYVTTFKGQDGLPADTESVSVWKQLFSEKGIQAEMGKRIYSYDAHKNWWSRSGIPTTMPVGEPGGPDSEVFYEFTSVPHRTEFGTECHPNCDCGRFLEIGNSVFMEYKKETSGFVGLPNKNVDFGGGLERLIMAVENQPDMFRTHLFWPLIQTIQHITNRSYDDLSYQAHMRIVADHMKASVFLIKDGVIPSNKEQGYILRRLLRRLTVKLRGMIGSVPKPDLLTELAQKVLLMYEGTYFNVDEDTILIREVIADEVRRFSLSLEKGLKQIAHVPNIDGKVAFDLYQSYGFPLEVTEELLKEKGQSINREEFVSEFNKHKTLSRTASAGKFKGGLADHSEQTIKYHTATHLLHRALSDLIPGVRQEGSNITSDRLRFDFSSSTKPTDDQIQSIEKTINEIIQLDLPVTFEILDKVKAEELGAKSFFREKYPDKVKVYFVGGSSQDPKAARSMEFCGGPHVTHTGAIGSLTIKKCEKIGSGLYRIYAE